MEPGIDVSENPLNWWRRKEVQYPKLGKIAKKYFCVSATSASLERVFSISGLVSQDRRNRIAPERLDKVIFINKNMKE